MRVEESVEIARSIEDVWAFVADPLNDPRWCRKVKSVDPSGARRWTVLHQPVPLRPAVELVLEHIEEQAPTRLTMREDDAASIFHVEYQLGSSGTGTKFTQTSSIEWRTLPGLLHGVFNRGVRRDVRAQLRTLKRVLEAT